MGDTKTVAAAFLAAQKAFPEITREHENPHYGNRYAKLEDLIRETKTPLNDAGFGLRFDSELREDGHLVVTAILHHDSGETLFASAFVPSGARAQEQGSAYTYARRYALEQVLGIAASADDDANEADGKKPPAKRKPAARKPPADSSPKDDPAPADPKLEAEIAAVELEKGWEGAKVASSIHSAQYAGWTFTELVLGKGEEPEKAKPFGQRALWLADTRKAAAAAGELGLAKRCDIALAGIAKNE